MDVRQRRFAQAIERYNAILAQRADHPLALAGLGVVHDLSGKPDLAQATYRRGLSAHPDDPALRSNLGLSLSLNGKPREAVNVLLDIMGVPTALPQGRQNLALAYAMMGRDDAAESILLGDMPRANVQDNLEFYREVRLRLSGEKALP
jgi:Flp pilus assembly protein TadD